MLSLHTNTYPNNQHCLAAHVLYVSGDEGFVWVSVCISEGLAQGRLLQEEEYCRTVALGTDCSVLCGSDWDDQDNCVYDNSMHLRV